MGLAPRSALPEPPREPNGLTHIRATAKGYTSLWLCGLAIRELKNFPMAAFLLEVGTEDLPAQFVSDAIAQWQAQVPAKLEQVCLGADRVSVYGSPRRLAILIEGLPDRQADRQEEVKGPPIAAAYKDGVLTPAGAGFAKKQGVDPSALEIRPTEKGDCLYVTKTIAGRDTAEILTELVPSWINGLEGKRFMRWGDGDLKFSRPIRSLILLLDDRLLPLTIDNQDTHVTSDRLSQGHRVLHPDPVAIAQPQDYVATLRSAFIMVDPAERRAAIVAQTDAAAAQLGGQAEMPADLLAEVTNLIEWPTAVVGSFDDSYLSLPPEVITMVMISHQRYFPIYRSAASGSGSQVSDSSTAISAEAILFPNFVTISNGDPSKSAIIAEGNGRVVRARLADGEYFYRSDAKQSLDQFQAKLETVTFQEALGSMAAKVDRIVQVTDRLLDQLVDPLAIAPAEATQIRRAARICKADLVSQMVFEFPELQGVMGEKYARVGGEADATATAIREHYLPKGAGDSLPQSRCGQVIAIADRLDTLISIFGLGQIPSGSSDPFALRRAANGILSIIAAAQLPLNLDRLLGDSVGDFAATFPDRVPEPATLASQLKDFFLQRLRTQFQEDQSIDYDLVNAILGDGKLTDDLGDRALQDPLDAGDRARFLQQIRDDKRLDAIYETVNRSSKLAAQGNLDRQVLDPAGLVDPSLFQQPTEQRVLDGLIALLPKTQAAQASRDYGQLVAALGEIAPAVSQFFDGDQSVMVMDEDPSVRQNRLNLLGLLRNHGRVLGDFGAIVKG
jgi:glycyl-tRNA synthetase beta chain